MVATGALINTLQPDRAAKFFVPTLSPIQLLDWAYETQKDSSNNPLSCTLWAIASCLVKLLSPPPVHEFVDWKKDYEFSFHAQWDVLRRVVLANLELLQHSGQKKQEARPVVERVSILAYFNDPELHSLSPALQELELRLAVPVLSTVNTGVIKLHQPWRDLSPTLLPEKYEPTGATVNSWQHGCVYIQEQPGHPGFDIAVPGADFTILYHLCKTYSGENSLSADDVWRCYELAAKEYHANRHLSSTPFVLVLLCAKDVQLKDVSEMFKQPSQLIRSKPRPKSVRPPPNVIVLDRKHLDALYSPSLSCRARFIIEEASPRGTARYE